MPLKQPKRPKKYRKLTFADAQAVRAAREQNPALTLAELAAKFGTTRMSISRVLRGEVHQEEKGRKLLPEDIQKLRYLARTDTLTQGDLAERFGLSQGEVSRIVNGQLYADVPPSAEEQAQIARLEAITEMVDREYARFMASIPRA
jgi:transcriptional regulator with XRE-family HTH domain